MICDEMIHQLKIKGMKFSEKLSENDLDQIEQTYEILLPKSLRAFYRYGIPYSEHKQERVWQQYPRWTDFSAENIANIKKRMRRPVYELLFDIADGYWLSSWGNRPESTDEAIIKYLDVAKHTAPQLIPIFSHRYMPLLAGVDDPPIISAVGIDIIYYGNTLHEYVSNEFLRSDGDNLIVSDNCTNIPFWSEVINDNGNT